jgi:putative restriction endonuclease
MDWLERAAHLRRWSRRGERAPHKPLLLLYALGRYRNGACTELRYRDMEHDLGRLLAEYGPPRPTSPAYPFHHLVGDGVWEVHTDDGGGSPGTAKGALRSSGATGSLSPALRHALDGDPALLGQLVQVLLEANFPESLHAGIRAAVGLEPVGAEPAPVVRVLSGQGLRRRDPRVREQTMIAYEYRCAFCGYDGSIDGAAVGLEAAHVRWWAHDGPDDVSNCLCLCALHHQLFDRGALGLDGGRRIRVSTRFTGRGAAARGQVLDLAGRGLLGPQPGTAPVAPEHIGWHTAQVFRGEARAAV